MTYNKTDIPPLLNPWGGDAGVNPAVFMFAHQDDETLTFGAEIEAHKAAGRYCIGVLATDGRSSSTRGLTGLSVKDFVQARNLEFINAATQLGLDEVHFMQGVDAGLTQTQADAIVTYWYRRYPNASWKVPSDLDDNVDHRALGRSWRSIKNAYPATDVRFYIKPEQRAQYPGTITTFGGAATIAAAKEYKFVDPYNGRYGIGYLSVPVAVDQTIADPKSTWHYT